jgi:hypothetical protein
MRDVLSDLGARESLARSICRTRSSSALGPGGQGRATASHSSRASARTARACTSAHSTAVARARNRARACPMDGNAGCARVPSKNRPKVQNVKPSHRRMPSSSADDGSADPTAARVCSGRVRSARGRRCAAAQQSRAPGERPKVVDFPSSIAKFQISSRLYLTSSLLPGPIKP